MTNPNNQTNGASLEDCHTNFFALTDLCGIKWRKVVWGGGGGLTEWGEPSLGAPPSEPLEDPVLASYVKCISADMLCVWRRVSTPTTRSPGDVFVDQLSGLTGPAPIPPHHPPPLSLAAAKELWIFWYGEEPDLSSLVAPELLQAPDVEQGSWESGLSYECRSLLFKALHNLIERCLLSRDFVRIGKWYVQPYDSSEKVLEKSGHYSFSFDFFVHGESQVCASIDVRQHPPVRTLLASHLQQAALHSQPPVNVILAPFGLAGTLTGQTYRMSDPQTQRLLENWRFFYPVDRGPCHLDLPPAVEVLVGGMKLRYPSQYVLLTDMDDSTKALFSNQLDLDGPPTKIVPPLNRGLNRAGLLAERVWQESLVLHERPAVGNNPAAPTPGINSSANSGGSGGASNLPSSGASTGGGGSRANTPVSSGGGGGGGGGSVQAPSTPGQPTEQANGAVSLPQPGQWNFIDPTRKQACSCSCKRRKSRPSSMSSQVSSAPFHRRPPATSARQLRLSCGASMGQNDSVPIASVGSPNAPESPTPPSVPPPTDPTMPLLSPQPPQQHHIAPSPLLDDKVISTPIDFNAPKSVPSISNQMLSPYGEEGKAMTESVCGPGSVGTGVGGKATPLAARTPLAAPPPTPPPQPPPQTQPPPLPKRPCLTSNEYEDALTQEMRPSDLLYDYTLLEAWLNHPVKKFKPNPPSQPPTLPQQQTFKQEPSVPNPSPIEENTYNGSRGGPGDPYDFNEDGLHINTFKRVPIKEEDNKSLVNGTGPSPSSQGKLSSNNLFSSDNLQVSYNDLEQMFNHSDDNSGDETLAVTPPSSNKGLEEPIVTTLCTRPFLTNGVTGVLRPEELCKMFPTPPSLEHPLPSPGDDHPQATSPHHQPIQDWSYVFKPSPISKFVGSSKYAPLTSLPSHGLPPVTLPPNSVYKPSWSVQQEKQNSSSSGRPPNSNSGGGGGGGSTGSSCGPRTPSLPALPPATPTAEASPAPPAPWGRAPPPPYSPAQVQYPPPATITHPHVPPPEANSIVVIILLSDTAFNIFRDHNFDSCTLCVCNDSPKGGNIRGSDAGMYLIGAGGGGGYSPLSPSPHTPLEEEHIRCNCGFSAVVNRRLSHRSGLFIEDEIEICGIFDEMGERENSICLGRLEMELMRGQCVIVNSSSNALYRAATQFRPASPLPIVNLLALRDSNYISLIALEQGRMAAHHSQSLCKMEEMGNYSRSGTGPVHRWAHMRAKGPPSNQDIVRVMKQLQPLLQEAIQKKCTTRLWEAPTVSGPLTWRQFHRLAGRGADDRCEPQPIPSLVMGREKDWITLAPYAIHLWEKLLLEPFSYSRDIAYVVVAPDHDYILNSVRSFFKELSSMYEVCRLGRHVPITKVLRDGILRVGKTAAVKLANEPLDEWFSNLSDSYHANMLKLYAQVCRHHLAPHLSQVPLDKTLLDPPEGSNPPPRSNHSSSDQPNTPKQPDSQEDGNSSGCEYSLSAGGSTGGCGGALDDDGSDPPMIVVYLVEPFTVGADSPELQRLSCVGLLKAFNAVIANVPEQLRSNITLQVISLESILELGRSGETNKRSDHMRTLAVSVFCQARKTMAHSTNNIKALTGFGTAAANEAFLKNKDEKNRAPYKVYTPAYILAKSREKPSGAPGGADSESGVSSSDHCSVLYVSYCLSEDQRWLLATATDEQGLLLESISINIHIPNRARRRRASARRAGLQKLMDFMLGVMSQSVTPWRLIVGRVGRIGHGELKGWSWLLSRKSLLKASKNLKEICGQCNLLYPHDVPCILSACLVSLEPDSALRVMPDQFTPDERFSQASVKCSLSTPGDVSATHILVFPTSATTQSSQTAFQEQHINVPELGDDELLSVLNDDMPDGMSDFNDIFSHWPETDGGGVGENEAPNGGGPGRGGRPDSPCPTPPHSHPHSPYQHSVGRTSGESNEEVGALLQQPLALGYLVSTAPTGRMPRWFWSACPHLETVNPPFLKNALHLHSTGVLANSDELLQQQTAVACHALDSQYTTDVLRYVLEGYNALSWLALDSNTHDRLSCLPVHIQVLMQLYHMTAALA